MTDRDKRREERRPLVTFAWYWQLDGTDDGPVEGVAHACDISEHGLGIVTPRQFDAGTRLFFVLSTVAGELTGIGTVAHCADAEGGCFRLGVSIDVVPPTHRSVLSQLLRDQRLREGAGAKVET